MAFKVLMKLPPNCTGGSVGGVNFFDRGDGIAVVTVNSAEDVEQLGSHGITVVEEDAPVAVETKRRGRPPKDSSDA